MDCSDGVCEVLNASGVYKARMIGPDSYPFVELNQQNLHQAACLVIPGGHGDADQFDGRLSCHVDVIRQYVGAGGRYLGICMGAYFAGHHYFNILHKDTQATQYIKRPGSTVKRENHDVVVVDWVEHTAAKHTIYFHDGAAFIPAPGHTTTSGHVIARYQNGDAAALIQNYKSGKVGVIGPHPEAQKWWFYCQTRIRKRWKDCIQHHLMLNFLKQLMQ